MKKQYIKPASETIKLIGPIMMDVNSQGMDGHIPGEGDGGFGFGGDGNENDDPDSKRYRHDIFGKTRW